MNPALAIAVKDLKVELRSKQMLSAMFLFSLLIVLAFRFAFSDSVASGSVRVDDLAAAALWICFSFAAILGMYTSFAKEKDRETLEGLLLAPVDRSSVFIGKALSNLTVVFTVDLLSISFFALFFSFDFGGHAAEVVTVALLGTVTLVMVGTLVAAISVNARAREVLLPILLIPLIAFSVIVPSVTATRNAIAGSISDAAGEIQILVAFALVFAAIGYSTIDYVLEG